MFQLCHSSSCLAPEKFNLTQSQQFHFSSQLKQEPPPPFPSISSQSKIETVPFDSIQTGDWFNITYTSKRQGVSNHWTLCLIHYSFTYSCLLILVTFRVLGTTFDRHLVKDMSLEDPCICPRKRKRCDYFRPNTINEQWLLSRSSTGWKCSRRIRRL